MPELDLARLRGRERQRRVGLLPEDVRVVRPRVLEAVLLGELHQLDHPLVRRVRQDRHAEAEHGASPVAWQGNEHIAAKTPRTVVWLYLLFAFAGGVVLPFQAGINAQLADWLGSPVRAAFVSFLVGTIVLLVAAAFVFKPLPSWGRLGDAPWWVWVGGALGAFYVAASIVSAPKLGAATLVALVVAGQGWRRSSSTSSAGSGSSRSTSAPAASPGWRSSAPAWRSFASSERRAIGTDSSAGSR